MRCKRRRSGGGITPWPAFVDLLAATSLLFVTLIAIVVFVAGDELGRGGRIETERDALIRYMQTDTADLAYEVVDSLPLIVRLTLNVDATFPSSRWEMEHLRFPARNALRAIGERLRNAEDGVGRNLYQELQIRGHSDHRPITSGSWSNWELSAARAGSVARFLTDSAGLSPCRISASGVGPYRPLVSPDSRGRLPLDSMRLNRRIDIEIIPWSVRILEGGGITSTVDNDCYEQGDKVFDSTQADAGS